LIWLALYGSSQRKQSLSRTLAIQFPFAQYQPLFIQPTGYQGALRDAIRPDDQIRGSQTTFSSVSAAAGENFYPPGCGSTSLSVSGSQAGCNTRSTAKLHLTLHPSCFWANYITVEISSDEAAAVTSSSPPNSASPPVWHSSV